jgi:DNA polymerase-3 subunit epsilon
VSRLGVPWREASFAVVDLELTGLDPGRDEIVSWCVVPVDGGAISVAAIREALVRPRRGSGDPALRIHGLPD